MKKRIIATILSIALMITSVPWTALDVFAASYSQVSQSAKIGADEYVADADTFESWKIEFSQTSTEFTGAVWTDKSVFESGTLADDNTTNDDSKYFDDLKVSKFVSVDQNGNITMGIEDALSDVTVGEDNFLVAMSALGSTKEIVGYSALPSDTVFVLDVSNSMSNTDLAQMVEATNKAIEKLQNLNRHNRIGVVVYGTDAAVLLDIDRYITTATATDSNNKSYPVYIELNDNYSQIMTARSRKSSTGNDSETIYNSIDFAAIANGIPARNNREDWDDYYDRIAAYLEGVEALSVENLGVNINWEDAVDDKNWNQSWEQFIRNRVWNALNNQQGQNQQETSDITNSAGNLVTASVTASGATYIQGGMNVAHELFRDVDGKVIETGLIQGGTARIPITVLMSDGAPTYGSTSYTNASNNNRNLGGGGNSSISDSLVFPAQLTAAYLSKQMEEYYGREALVYTLGLGLEYDEARRVLNPSNYTSTTINTWWDNYEDTAQNDTIDGYNYNGKGITRNEPAIENDKFQSLINHRYYVDEYFGATDADGLVGAFDNIVEAIILQSKYYPTLVESGKYDLDGYISFEDEIGGFVEVKDVKGMLLGDTIYTGQDFVNALNNTTLFGNASTWTEYGNELLESISERLGIDNATARTLLATAWRSTDGQLRTVDGVSKNYIGWYGNAKNEYLAHWDENHSTENYPEGAVYLNKCYIFQGDLSNTYESLAGADMMHIIVQVHEEIGTGHQCVIWKIPASLVPLVTYRASVEGNQLVNGMDATLTTNLDTASPISLLYEVGMDDDINSVNLVEKVKGTGHVADEHKILDSNGNTVGYAFYSNRWGEQHTNDGSGATDVFDNGNMATVSHFVPSKENERYYYTENTIVYRRIAGGATESEEDDVFEPYTGATAPAGSGYFYEYKIIENGRVTIDYLPVSTDVIVQAKAVGDDTNQWYIPAGIIHQAIDDYTVNKTANKTGTMPYSDKLYIKDGTQIYDFLGNNGRWIKYSATGLAITKTIDDATVATGSQTFNFVVTLTGVKEKPANLSVMKIDGTQVTYTPGADANGDYTLTIPVNNGETVYITGLDANTAYTIKENHHDHYVVKSATGETVTGSGKNTVVSGKVEQYVIDYAEFINTETTHAGDLVVSKTVTHPYGDDYPIPVNQYTMFAVNVKLTVPSGVAAVVASTAFKATGTVKFINSNGEYATGIVNEVTTDAEGNVVTVKLSDDTVLTNTSTKINWWLSHEDYFTIKGIHEDVEYTVTETGTYAGFTQTTPADKLSGTILSDEAVYAELVNNYTPAPVSSEKLTAVITKVIDGRAWQEDDSFGFTLEKYTGSGWEPVNGVSATVGYNSTQVENNAAARQISNTANMTFTAANVGKSYFRIGEVKGNIAGITYDETYRYYSVTISDTDMDGKLDIIVEPYQGVTVTELEENSYKLEVTFTNHYQRAVANISLKKNLTNNTGVDVPMNEFEFEFCTLENCTKGAECPDKDAHFTFKPNANGDLTFPLVYVESELNDVNSWVKVTGEGETATTQNYTSSDAAGNITVDANGDPILDNDNNVPVPEGATKAKTFTYYLWEKNNGKNGMAYDNTVYQVDVVVTVTKGKDKNDVAVTSTTVTAISGNSAAVNNVAQFSNTYTVDPVPTSTTINVTKNLDGRNIIANEFEFELYSAHSTFEKIALLETQKTVEGGKTSETVQFKLPTEEDGKYSKAGAYYYVVEEKAGTNTAITYDPAKYHITVIVDVKTDGEDANKADELYVESILVNKVGGETVEYDTEDDIAPLVFNNKYTILQGTSITVNGDKDVTGKTVLLENEFEFGLYDAVDATTPIQTSKSAAVSGAFSFKFDYSQTGEYTYYIKEIGSTKDDSFYGDDDNMSVSQAVYKVVVNVTDTNGDGNLEASSTVTKIKDDAGAEKEETVTVAKFTNTYTPDTVKAEAVVGSKFFADTNNQAISLNAGAFDFAMYKSDQDFKTAEFNVLANNSGAGIYAQNGYKFTGTYDEATHKFNGELITENIPADQFVIDLEFTKAGTYYYILKEVAGGVVNTHYDTAEYYVTYFVTEAADGSGKLSATSQIVYGGQTQEKAQFRNYQIRQTVDAQIKVTKDLVNNTTVNVPMSMFQFGLYDANGTLLKDADGNDMISYASTEGDASFNLRYDSIKDSDDDYAIPAGDSKEFTYFIKEILPEGVNAEYELNGMTYDASEYKVVVRVSADGTTGALSAQTEVTKTVASDGTAVTQSSTDVVFTNTYTMESAKVNIGGEKAMNGRDDIGEFEFGLYHAVMQGDETTGWSAGELVKEKDKAEDYYLVNNSDETFTFPEIEYSAEGIHYYVVKETVPASAEAGITYDTTEYLVKVVVTNGGTGSFVATDSVVTKRVYNTQTQAYDYTTSTNETPLELVITNTFTPDPIDVTIEGAKNFVDNHGAVKTLKAGDFEFELYQSDEHFKLIGSAIEKVTNDANGAFEFNALTNIAQLRFTDAETRYFIVKEVVGSNPTIDYSGKEYNVIVNVTKDSSGTLVPQITVTNLDAGTTSLTVTNTYTSQTAAAKVDLVKTLTNNTGVDPQVSLANFEFKLYTDAGCNTQVAANDANLSAVVFSNKPNGRYTIDFTYKDTDLTDAQAKIFTYYVKETVPQSSVAGMKYDGSVYKIDVKVEYINGELTASPVITKVVDNDNDNVDETNKTATEAAFNNIYTLEPATIEISGSKIYSGWTKDNDNAFTFELYKTTATGNYADGSIIAEQTVSKPTTGDTATFKFTNTGKTAEASDYIEELVFTSKGTYYFAVRELNGGLTLIDDGHGIVYSGTQYVVVVDVDKDSANPGKLKATQHIYRYGHDGSAEANIRFTNTDLDGKTTIDIIGNKVVTDAAGNLVDMSGYDQAFDFELYQANPDWSLVDAKSDTATIDPVFSVENREDLAKQENDGYNIEFIGIPLEYNQVGTHTYRFVVKELIGTDPTIGYDTKEYRITVTGAFTEVDQNGTKTHPYTVSAVTITDASGNAAGNYTTVNGKKVIVLGSGAAFNNVYTPFDTENTGTGAEIKVNKELINDTGIALGNEQFTFGLYKNEACTDKLYVDATNHVVATGGTHATFTATSDNNGSITLNYTDKDVKPDAYTYYLKEIAGDKAGMTYSSQVYKVEVTLNYKTENTEKKLYATSSVTPVSENPISMQSADDTAVIVNRYALAPAFLNLSGHKVLPEFEIRKDDFTFALYEVKADPVQNTVDEIWSLDNAKLIDYALNDHQTVNATTNDYDGFIFDRLTFDKEGTYLYVVEETASSFQGMIYDADRYQIKVVVEADDKDDIDDGTKGVWDELVVKSVTIERVNYTYDNGTRKIDTSEDTVDGIKDGKVDADAIVFTNHYTAKGSFSVSGTKAIDKRDWRDGDSFTFELFSTKSSGIVIEKVAERTVTSADELKEFVFENIEISGVETEIVNNEKVAKIGTHYFMLKENNKNDTDTTAMVYDETIYIITVNTKDNGDGSLTVGSYDAESGVFTEGKLAIVNKTTGEPLGESNTMAFVNTYQTKPVSAEIKGTKVLENADISDFDGKFTFELYLADANWDIYGNEPVATTTNDGENFAFKGINELTFDRAGVYRFIVKEHKGDNPIVIYDDAAYRVAVTVAEKLADTDNDGIGDKVVVENGKAVLVVENVNTVGGKLEFTNSYNPTTVNLNIVKNLTCTNGATHTLGDFKFKVEGSDSDAFLAYSGNDGTIAVPLTFTELDLDTANNYAPKTYTFKISEVDTGIDRMTYDDRVYTVEIEVYAENGVLKTAITQNGVRVDEVKVQFNNTYEGEKSVPDSPVDPGRVVNTGDTSNNILYAGVMATSAACLIAILFIMKKRKEDEDEAEA